MSFGFRVEIIWGTGAFYDDQYDDVTDWVKLVTWNSGLDEAYQDMGGETACDITLYNEDGFFSPESEWSVHRPAGSHPWVPGIKVRVYLVGHDDTDYLFWEGMFRHLGVSGDRVGPTANDEIVVSCTGYKIMFDEIVSDYVPAASRTTGTVVALLAEEAGFDTLERDIDPGELTLEYYGRVTQNKTIMNMIAQLTQAERGRFFFNRDGLVTWWDRHHFYTANLTPVQTFDSTEEEGPAFYDYDYTFGEYYANIVRVTMQPQTEGVGSETLWTLDEPIDVPPGHTENYRIDLKDQYGRTVGATSLATASETYSSGSATITVTAQGSQADLEIDNSAGSVHAILTALSVTGTPTVQQNKITYEYGTATGLTAVFELTIPALAGTDDGKYIAQYELARRSTLQGIMKSISFLHVGGVDHLGFDVTYPYLTEIGDRIRVIEESLNHDKEYWLIGEEHSIDANLRHEIKWYLEPVDNQQYWLIGEAGFSELGETTWLGY